MVVMDVEARAADALAAARAEHDATLARHLGFMVCSMGVLARMAGLQQHRSALAHLLYFVVKEGVGCFHAVQHFGWVGWGAL